jgi:hypothetical protein
MDAKRPINDSPLWEIDTAESTGTRLKVKDPIGWYDAAIKVDGCIDYTRYFNTPRGVDTENDEEGDSIHFCDIDAEIARLQALKRVAANYFAKHSSPANAWHPETVESTRTPIQIEGK